MAKKHYNKLVRDRIPEIIGSKGGKCEYEILSSEAYLEALEAKLDEEVAEYHENPCIEELVDIWTVLLSICHARKYDIAAASKMLIDKMCERGGFDKKIFLKWVEED